MNFAPYIPSQIADIVGLQSALNAKEPTVAAGITSQFYRGDKTWQTLNYLAVAGLSTVAHTGAYADLSGVPSLASVALSGAYTDLNGRPTLATVATTGAYADLTGKPTLFSGAYVDLTGKPTLATVAGTGAYSDLTGKPSLFSGAFPALTGIPTTVAGYGITDAYTKTASDALYKPIAYQPAAANISDATTAGRSMITAADAAAQKSLLSLGNVDNTSDATKQTANDSRYGRLGSANTWSAANTYTGGLISSVANQTDYALNLFDTIGSMFRVRSRGNTEPVVDMAGQTFVVASSGQWQFQSRPCLFQQGFVLGDTGLIALSGAGGAGSLFINTRDSANFGPVVLGASTTSLTVGGSTIAAKVIECARPVLIHRSLAGETPLTVRGAISQTAPLLEMQQYSSTSTARVAARIDATLPTLTDASRTGRLTLSATDYSATREGMRIEANGSAAALGFYGASAVAQPVVTGSKASGAALTSLLSALVSLGLITDSTTA